MVRRGAATRQWTISGLGIEELTPFPRNRHPCFSNSILFAFIILIINYICSIFIVTCRAGLYARKLCVRRVVVEVNWIFLLFLSVISITFCDPFTKRRNYMFHKYFYPHYYSAFSSSFLSVPSTLALYWVITWNKNDVYVLFHGLLIWESETLKSLIPYGYGSGSCRIAYIALQYLHFAVVHKLRHRSTASANLRCLHSVE